MLSGRLWPAHPKPQADEILSSWLVNLARANGLKLHTFCDIAWPHKAIWNRDIDKSADDCVLNVLAEKTATPLDQVYRTILQAYEGRLYEKHNPFGNTKWIMPVGIYHRTRRRFGMQCCPLCLSDDAEPFFRKRWRLAFVTVCESHGNLLIDRCPTCSSPLTYHRCGLEYESIAICSVCGNDLRKCRLNAGDLLNGIFEFQKFLLDALDKGWVHIPTIGPVYSHNYFEVLHHVMRLFATGKRSKNLREHLIHYIGEPNDGLQFQQIRNIEFMNVKTRCLLGVMASWLLNEWPERFVWFCRKHALLSSNLLQDMDNPPYWYWRTVHQHLYDASYHPANGEILEAVRRLETEGKSITEVNISKLLGVRQVFRKRRKNNLKSERFSMKEDHVLDGDLALVRPPSTSEKP